MTDLAPMGPDPNLHPPPAGGFDPGLSSTAVDDLTAKVADRHASGNDVDVAVFAPASAAIGDDFLVQALFHLPEQADAAAALALQSDQDTSRRGGRTLALPIPFDTQLDVTLSMRGLQIDEPVQKLRWLGRPESVQFFVTVPEEFRSSKSPGVLQVSHHGVPLGSVKWQQAIGGDGRRSDVTLQGDSASRYRRAFISYASADRDAVLARVQIMRLYKQDFFQDVLDLDPGTRWERRLYEEIARCDLFLLFWSNAAKESVWVRKEATEALRLAQAAGEFGPPTLCPVLLDGPPVPLPWPEVEHLHFNDQLIYFMGRPG